MAPEKTIDEMLKEATEEYFNAMRENIEASKTEIESKIRKEKARYNLQMTRQRLDGIYKESMEIKK